MNTISEKIPDEVVNIYTAIEYLTREAFSDGLFEIHKILKDTAERIKASYSFTPTDDKKIKEVVNSIFLSLVVLKYFTTGSKEARQGFMDAIAAAENVVLPKDFQRKKHPHV